MKKNIIPGLIVILGMLFILLISTLTVTQTKGIYNYSIEKFNITENVSMSKSEIIENYSYIVDYILGVNKNEDFTLPTLSYSADGAIHFEEVRNLFDLAKNLLLILFISIASLFMLYYRSYRNFKPIKTMGMAMTIFPIIITLVVSVNFNFFFTVFHKIFFNNDKWLFDPLTDPIINILPEEFFALCGGAIILLCIIAGIALWIGYNLTSTSKGYKDYSKSSVYD